MKFSNQIIFTALSSALKICLLLSFLLCVCLSLFPFYSLPFTLPLYIFFFFSSSLSFFPFLLLFIFLSFSPPLYLSFLFSSSLSFLLSSFIFSSLICVLNEGFASDGNGGILEREFCDTLQTILYNVKGTYEYLQKCSEKIKYL